MAATEQLTIEVEIPNAGKKVVRFTSLNLLPMGIVRRTRHDDTEQMWAIIEWAIAPEDLTILDEMPASQLIPTLSEMQKKSQITVGESTASSTPSKSTARRSKPTSSSGA